MVVVNYNAGDHLRRCLDSVVASAGEAALEIVVVDNASRDGSAERATRAHPEARLIRNPDNRGFAAAANQGIRATAAPFVLLINPDAEIAGGTLSGLLKVARDRPGAGVIGPRILHPDGTVYPSARKVPGVALAVGHALLSPFFPRNPFTRAYTMADWDRSFEREVDWVSGSCMLLQREALDQVGLLDEGYFLYAEDADLCTRLRAAGWSVLFSPELDVVHEGGVSTGRSARMVVEHSRSVYRYVSKHWARGWRRVALPLAWAVLRLRAAIVVRRSARG